MDSDSTSRSESANALLKVLSEIDEKLLMFGGVRRRLTLHAELQEFARATRDSSTLFSLWVCWLLDCYHTALVELSEAAAVHQPELTDSEWSNMTMLTPRRKQEIDASLAQYHVLLSKVERLERYSRPLQLSLRRETGA